MSDFADLTQLIESLLLDQELEEFKELLEPRPESIIDLDTSRQRTTTISCFKTARSNSAVSKSSLLSEMVSGGLG